MTQAVDDCPAEAERLALLLVLLLLAPLLVAGYPWEVCGKTGKFTPNSTYQANLAILAAALPRNISTSPYPDLFATAVVGTVPGEQVAALALCRGDANATACSACLTAAFQDLQDMCSYDRDAAVYYDPCILYYSGDPGFLSSADNLASASTGRVNLRNVTSEPARFNRVAGALVNATADYAAYNSTWRYASGEADLGQEEFPKVFSWAQCTPDLSPLQCSVCLAGIIAKMPRVFANRVGGRVLGIRCSYRYEVYSFLNSPVMVRLLGDSAPAPAPEPELEPTTPPTAGRGARKYSIPGIVLVLLLPTIAGLVMINLLAWLCFWRTTIRARKPQITGGAEEEGDNDESIESMLVDISILRAATGDFAESNKLGEGGFGQVYKGTLPDGDEIAVKRLSSSTQGVGELKNELALVAKLHHKNLVRLVGVCLEQQEKLLVYEFVPNRSLDQILFEIEKRQQLDWAKRYNIIHGIARGLQYLHEDSQLRIVHRDLKPSNILLDTDMNPKISDFGLARLFVRGQTQGVTNHVVGTYGYMAPEFMRGSYSVKSDVFSFGVMVLEIVTGKKNNNDASPQDLLTLVWDHWVAGVAPEAMIDPQMCSDGFSQSNVLRCIHIGLLCVQSNPAVRPVMSSVVLMLGSDTVSLKAPSEPAFYGRNKASASSSTSSFGE